MLSLLQILTVVVVAVEMALALAHALEMPGKMRLTKDMYFVVQRIYYPGFTIGGISEPVGFILTLVLLFFTPRPTAAFWLTLVALTGLVSMQIVYWVFIHPVNKVWMHGESLGSAGSGFFGFGRSRIQSGDRAPDWTDLRNRWEYGHVARAALAAVSFIALVIAIS
jgi:Anthrone oxygenase